MIPFPKLSVSSQGQLEPYWAANGSIINLVAPPGISCDRAKLRVEVKCGDDGYRPFVFIYDTGADLTTIPIQTATSYGIPFSRSNPGASMTLAGPVKCFYDYISIRSALSGKEYKWLCSFSDTSLNLPLLGRAGFLDEFATTIRGGQFIVMCDVTFRRFLRHYWENLIARIRSDPTCHSSIPTL